MSWTFKERVWRPPSETNKRYHFEAASVAPAPQIPALFALAMGVDALVALVAGRMFDRIGLVALLCVPLLSLPVSPLAFSESYGAAVAAVALCGAVMGVQETIMRAAVAEMVPTGDRGTAYDIFNTAYGLFWFLGSAMMGLLYEARTGYLVAFSVVLELASLPMLALLIRHRRESL